MKKKRILVLTDDLPWGHRSIARAVFGYLKKREDKQNFEVDYTEVKMSFSALNNIYVFMYRYLSLSNKLATKAMEYEILRNLLLETIDNNLILLKKAVEKYKPDVIISSYFAHSHSLIRWREKENKHFKLWTVVSDPWTINPIMFVKGADLHLVYDEVSEGLAMKYGIEKDKILKTGWWVRENIGEKKLQTPNFKLQVREKLGVEDDRPIVFIGGGSLGTNSLIKLLPVLMMIKKKCLIIFNTGTDKLAYKMISEFLKLFNKTMNGDMVQIKCYGWIDNMAEMLATSDIVFGKAGPNFLFDVVASRKPFVAISHMGGQEDGNIEIIRKKKLGWVKEGIGQSESFLLKYLDNPKKFNTKFEKTIDEEAKRNEKSLGKILSHLRRCFNSGFSTL